MELEQTWSAQGGMCTGEEEFSWGFRRLGQNGETDLEGPGVVVGGGEIPVEALDSC